MEFDNLTLKTNRSNITAFCSTNSH